MEASVKRLAHLVVQARPHPRVDVVVASFLDCVVRSEVGVEHPAAVAKRAGLPIAALIAGADGGSYGQDALSSYARERRLLAATMPLLLRRHRDDAARRIVIRL